MEELLGSDDGRKRCLNPIARPQPMHKGFPLNEEGSLNNWLFEFGGREVAEMGEALDLKDEQSFSRVLEGVLVDLDGEDDRE